MKGDFHEVRWSAEASTVSRGGCCQKRRVWSAEVVMVIRGGYSQNRWVWSAEVGVVSRGGCGQNRWVWSSEEVGMVHLGLQHSLFLKYLFFIL